MANLAIVNTKQNLEQLLDAYKPKVATLLPANSGYTPEKMCYMLVKAASASPNILKSTQVSVLGAFLTSAQLGLEPNTPMGFAHLIPYYNNKIGAYELTLQLGYQGLLELIFRTGQVKRVFADVIYKDDSFEYEQGLQPILKHKPNLLGDRKAENVIGAYAVVDLFDGGQNSVVLTRADIEKVKASSKQKGGVWESWFEEMAKKTALKRLIKFLKKTPELAKAVDTDSKAEVGKAQIIDMESGEIIEKEDSQVADTLDDAVTAYSEMIDNASTKEDLEGIWSDEVKAFSENERVPVSIREALIKHFQTKLSSFK